MITNKKIINAVHGYRTTIRISAMFQRQDEYRALVKIYGVGNVALASGLTIGTVNQYLCATSPNIGYEPLEQAKSVFNKLAG